MRTMLTGQFSKGQSTGIDFVILQTIARRKSGKSGQYYLPVKTLFEALKKGRVVDQDGSNFLTITHAHGHVHFRFAWIQGATISPTGYVATIEHIAIPALRLTEWLHLAEIQQENTPVFRCLAVEKQPNRLIFTASAQKQVAKITQYPLLKRKFIKSLRGFQLGTIDLFDDGSFGCFFWRETGGGIHGGLILHKDYEDPDNLAKAKFSIHT